MMQSFTKTELAWIYEALKHETIRKIEQMKECEIGSPAYHLAELARDNTRTTMYKIHEALNGNCKRIAIK